MINSNLLDEYYIWLITKIDTQTHPADRYQKLLDALYNTEFTWSVYFDRNRAIDGLNLRNAFKNETWMGEYHFVEARPEYCSLLEMLIALAVRMENAYMYNLSKGDRTCVWFWLMIENLNLIHMDDFAFNGDLYERIIDNFLNRRISRDGSGGLFTVTDDRIDMREAEIWYQMNYFLSENYDILA